MRITNHYGLPAPLVNAIRNDAYSKGESDISVTQLVQPPQPRKLLRGREPAEDASDRIWTLLGQAVHTILERAYPDTAITEKRLFTKVRGWIVSGQFDVYDNGALSDYKVTSVYAREAKREWINQLNLLAALCRRNEMPVARVEIVAIYRDWRKKEALSEDYPQSQVAVLPVPLWAPEEAEAFLEDRVMVHQMEVPPPCTDEERWLSPEKWALMKKGQKRAIKLYDARPEIELESGQYWGHRPGSYRRCESYCQAAPICPQWQVERTTVAA